MVAKVLPEYRTMLLKRAISEDLIHLLYIDIETSPNRGYWFDEKKPQFMSYKQIEDGWETKLITIQYMWEGDEKPKYLVWDKVGENFDDSSMLEEFITNILRKYPQNKLLVIGQNHKEFDLKVMNERARQSKLTPLYYNNMNIDTLKTSKQSFRKASHSLDYRSHQNKLGGKLYTDFKTWTDILEHTTIPEDEMIPYGLKDVVDLRQIFWDDLPYIEKLDASLEKLLLKMTAKCKKCEVLKQKKYDIEECKVDRKNGWVCLNCGDKFLA